MSAGDRLRLFVAADVPGSQLARIERATTELRAALPDARWAPASNQHITLKFLGGTDAGLLADVTAACEAAAGKVAAVRVRLSGLGAFPSSRRARVVWVGVEDPGRALPRLANELDQRLLELGFISEKRSFTAHLTLARLRTPRPVTDLLEAVPELDLPRVAIDHVTLYRSRLSPRGAVYEALGQFALA